LLLRAVSYVTPSEISFPRNMSNPENTRERKEMEKQKNPFEILGVCESSTAREVDDAFKRLAKSSHPDVMMTMHAKSSTVVVAGVVLRRRGIFKPSRTPETSA